MQEVPQNCITAKVTEIQLYGGKIFDNSKPITTKAEEKCFWGGKCQRNNFKNS